jgi:hypothetical protein
MAVDFDCPAGDSSGRRKLLNEKILHDFCAGDDGRVYSGIRWHNGDQLQHSVADFADFGHHT